MVSVRVKHDTDGVVSFRLFTILVALHCVNHDPARVRVFAHKAKIDVVVGDDHAHFSFVGRWLSGFRRLLRELEYRHIPPHRLIKTAIERYRDLGSFRLDGWHVIRPELHRSCCNQKCVWKPETAWPSENTEQSKRIVFSRHVG